MGEEVLEKTRDWLVKALDLTGTSMPSIRRRVEERRYEFDLLHEGKSREFVSHVLSSRLIREKALKAGGMGGVLAAPATLPVIGTLGTIALGVTVDLFYLIRAQVELCYEISAVYGAEMDEEELKAVVLALLGLSGGTGALKGIAATTLKNVVDHISSSYLRKGLSKSAVEVAERMGPRILGKAYRLIPLVGIPLSASINMASTMMVGNQARKYFNAAGEGLIR